MAKQKSSHLPAEWDDSVKLSPEEKGGLIAIPGSAVFPNIAEADQYLQNAKKFDCAVRTPKGSDVIPKLFKVIDTVGRRVWKDKAVADENLEIIFGAITGGVKPKNSPISLIDGDLLKPQYNSGCYTLKASRLETKGRPHVYDSDDEVVYEGEDVVGDPDAIPELGDSIWLLINVWGMREFDRINFELVAVKTVAKWEGTSKQHQLSPGAAITALKQLAGNGAFPKLPAQAKSEDAPKQIKASSKKKAAPKKKGAKKGGGSLFRK